MDPTFDPLPVETRLGPYAVEAGVDRSASVRWHPLVLGWTVGGHEDAARVLNDPRFASDRRRASLPGLGSQGTPLPDEFAQLGDVFEHMLLFSDPPAHSRMRGLIGQGLGPGTVARLRPRVAQAVGQILNRLEPGGGVDFMADVSRPLATVVLVDLLGVPPEDRPTFERWSGALEDAIDPRHSDRAFARALSSVEEMQTWLDRRASADRMVPGEDLVSFLVGEGVEKGRLTRDELLATVALLAAVGRETVSHLLGNTVLALLRHPGERDRLVERPELLATAVEESLRFQSPAQLTSRVATDSVRLGRHVVEAGDMVVVLLGVANRDPDRFPDPGRFDPARRPNPHLAFGAGPHGCPGANLARAQARLALAEFLRRFPNFRGDPEAAVWKPTVVHRGLSSLPLEL